MPSSIIEEDLMIEGNIRSSEGSVDIKGRVIGDVSVEMITIQLSGSVDGAMSATKIVVLEIEDRRRAVFTCREFSWNISWC